LVKYPLQARWTVVSNGAIVISATLTSRSCLPAYLHNYTRVYQPGKMASE